MIFCYYMTSIIFLKFASVRQILSSIKVITWTSASFDITIPAFTDTTFRKWRTVQEYQTCAFIFDQYISTQMFR